MIGGQLHVEFPDIARRLRLPVSIVMPCIVLSACVVGPHYDAPTASVRDAWIAPVDEAQVDGEWWRRLNDPVLTQLVDAAIANNKDLHEAAARLREARANRDAVLGRRLPQVGASATATENRLSSNGQLPIGKLPALEPEFSIYDVGFDASWEIDLWGGTRRAVESATARVQAAEEARRNVILQVIAEVVRSYIDLRSAQSLRASVAQDAEAQFQIAEIVADRFRVGAASRFDLTRAQAQASTTAGAIPAIEADAAAAAFRLAVLTGEPPESRFADLSQPKPLPVADLDVSVGLRSDLLRRRPDVRQAERELASATADVGVATAELFPRLSLIGAIGQQARSSGDLLASDSLRFQVGPSLRWPIFSAGRIRAQIRAADARADAAGIRYERAVLNALADSETAINRFASAERTTTARDQARGEAREALELARARYKAGEDDLTVLLQAQSAYSAADRLAIQARAGQLQQLAALYKALGGGWESAEAVLTP
jgi:NodT family efflux transporter outer membrane factor (OMF) lipoprotein